MGEAQIQRAIERRIDSKLDGITRLLNRIAQSWRPSPAAGQS